MLSLLCYATEAYLLSNGAAHSGLDHPTIISQQSLTYTAAGQYDLGNPSTETPSDDSKLCQGHSWHALGQQDEDYTPIGFLKCVPDAPIPDFCCCNIGTPLPPKPMDATETKSEKHTSDKIQAHSEPHSSITFIIFVGGWGSSTF